MRLPFRSRSTPDPDPDHGLGDDDLDLDDDLDDGAYGYETSDVYDPFAAPAPPPAHRLGRDVPEGDVLIEADLVETGERPAADGVAGDDDGLEATGPARRTATLNVPPPVRDALRAQIGSEARAEQRTAWAYLSLLTVLFAGLVVFGWVLSDERTGTEAGTDPIEAMTEQRTQLLFRVDGDVVAVEGRVPDESARQRLLERAGAVYGPENVVDQIIVDEEVSIDAGTVRYVGAAVTDDDRPEALRDAIAGTFDLDNRGFEVGYVDRLLDPVAAEVALDGTEVTLTGLVPDDAGREALVAAAEQVWGPANVDAASVAVGETTWTDGSIRLTGTTTETDTRPATFAALIADQIDPSIAVEAGTLTRTDNSELIAEIQVRIDELVETTPIQFAPTLADIEAESDQVLIDVAAALEEIPEVALEVVGHTDDVGDEQENLVLSQQRAAAVVDRLIELGIDEARLTSRGDGEANPLAPNDSDENRALNRRIEFVLVGTSSLPDADADADDTDADG